MKYEALVRKIMTSIGGTQNVNDLTTCVTRLRFRLKDESVADTAAIKATQGVLDVIQRGGQYQVVIGPHVEDVYNELVELYPLGGADAAVATAAPVEEKKGPVAQFLAMVSAIFQPVMGLLIAGGMIKAILVICAMWLGMSKTSGAYTILSAIGDAVFYFFPVVLGWSAARHFKLKEVMGIALGAILVYPTLVALTSADPLYTIFTGTIFEQKIYTDFFGIPVIMQSYSTTVIPILVIVWFAAKLDKWLNTVIPAVVKSLFVPLLTLVITAPLALLVIGPVAVVLQDLLGQLVGGLVALNPGIAGLVLGTFWSLLVVFGLHWGVIPLFAVNIANYGYDVINPLIFAGALASLGAAVGVIIRTRNVEQRSLDITAAISTFFGVNEPTLYGILIPRQKLMWATFLSAGVGGMIAGFSGAKLYNFTAGGPLGAPGFINPAGIDGGFIGMILGSLVAFGLAMAAALILGPKKDADGGEGLKLSLKNKKDAIAKA
ncbi:MAG: PTS transporter subunit EIIC [Propionicimonas sp.]|uniref:PTS transporter subunit EIIC n=1 Tax=Propionicimonas sp. TaxID=1955623 RepID=UPI003D10D4CA